jgi:hypothetical protein
LSSASFLSSAQHLVGLVRRQHRGRLVEDQQALQVELLEDLELLLLAGRERPRACRAAPLKGVVS